MTAARPAVGPSAPAGTGHAPARGNATDAGAVAALEAALNARAPGVHASTPLVRQLARGVGRMLELDAEALAILDVAVRVRDVGMIALPDEVVLATAALTPAGWAQINRHPVLGEQLLDDLPIATPVAEIVRSHHERWDGDGYPDGLRGDAIPLLSRIIATCDAFVAIASDRPHRRRISAAAALDLIGVESAAQFDPLTVEALRTALTHAQSPSTAADEAAAGLAAPRPASPEGVLDLKRALDECAVIPAFEPAYERVIAAATAEHPSGGEIVAAVEADTGLTVAVLRHAQTLQARRAIVNVADAVAELGATGVQEAVRAVPRAEFPWRTSRLQVLMHRSLVHAQAVARAADRIARKLDLPRRDDLLAAALLHDVGKLALGRGIADYPHHGDRAGTPEARVREEQRSWNVDHASLGGLLLARWGLPAALARVVAGHHSAESDRDLATYVRLADMVAHHAQGDPVDRGKMLELANLSGLSPTALREILFDLPHSSGSQRRRAEPSPLSPRETSVLRLLADGKQYKEIALELGVAPTTVRTHLHSVCSKLGVQDRAQAVLHTAEMGWL